MMGTLETAAFLIESFVHKNVKSVSLSLFNKTSLQATLTWLHCELYDILCFIEEADQCMHINYLWH